MLKGLRSEKRHGLLLRISGFVCFGIFLVGCRLVGLMPAATSCAHFLSGEGGVTGKEHCYGAEGDDRAKDHEGVLV